jgi:hypothetical protein
LLHSINYIDKDREIIRSNVFDIPERLKEIDSKYFVVRNHKKGYFEIHYGEPVQNRAHETLQLCVGYPELDARTLQLVRETRIENAKELIEEMERQNEKIKQDNENKALDEANWKTKEIYKYCNSHERIEAPDEGAFKTRFI